MVHSQIITIFPDSVAFSFFSFLKIFLILLNGTDPWSGSYRRMAASVLEMISGNSDKKWIPTSSEVKGK
jgi:hypothetical protein